MSRLIDADFEEAHYTRMLFFPTPDVTESDKDKARVILDFLKMAKTVEPERKGEWILVNGKTSINCSYCYHCSWSLSFEDTVRQFNFCPNCGADMRGEEHGKID